MKKKTATKKTQRKTQRKIKKKPATKKTQRKIKKKTAKKKSQRKKFIDTQRHDPIHGIFRQTLNEILDGSRRLFTYINLSNINIANRDFIGETLSHAELSNTGLANVSFQKAFMRGVNFWEAKARLCDFKNTYLVEGNLLYSQFIDCDFSNAKLQKAKLFSKFVRCDFSGADLREIETAAHHTDFFRCTFNKTKVTESHAGLFPQSVLLCPSPPVPKIFLEEESEKLTEIEREIARMRELEKRVKDCIFENEISQILELLKHYYPLFAELVFKKDGVWFWRREGTVVTPSALFSFWIGKTS